MGTIQELKIPAVVSRTGSFRHGLKADKEGKIEGLLCGGLFEWWPPLSGYDEILGDTDCQNCVRAARRLDSLGEVSS